MVRCTALLGNRRLEEEIASIEVAVLQAENNYLRKFQDDTRVIHHLPCMPVIFI